MAETVSAEGIILYTVPERRGELLKDRHSRTRRLYRMHRLYQLYSRKHITTDTAAMNSIELRCALFRWAV